MISSASSIFGRLSMVSTPPVEEEKGKVFNSDGKELELPGLCDVTALEEVAYLEMILKAKVGPPFHPLSPSGTALEPVVEAPASTFLALHFWWRLCPSNRDQNLNTSPSAPARRFMISASKLRSLR